MARIMHVIVGLDTGGAEMMLLKLLSTSNGRYQHAVVSLTKKGTLGEHISGLGVPIYTLDLRAGAPNPLRALAIRSIARKLRPQLIHGWLAHGNLAASFSVRWTQNQPAVIWGIHQSLYDLAMEGRLTSTVIRVNGWLSRRVAGIVYASHISRRHHEALGYDASNGVVIPNGFDSKAFIPNQQARLQVRDELGIAEDAALVGLVARYDRFKDQPGFLRAAALVTKPHPTARFVLVGRGIKEQPALQSLIAELGIQDNVLLLDERQDMPRFNAAFDIACSSSLSESFPNTVGEAMACGVPCVATDVGDSAHLVGDTGLCVPSRKPEALAQAISQLISAGAERRRQLGNAARRRVEENFSLPAIVGRYEDLYREHLSSDI